MANYESMFRTNYFKVNDAEKFNSLMNRVETNEEEHPWVSPARGGRFAFGCDGTLLGIRKPCTNEDDEDGEDEELDYNAFLNELQKCIVPGDACIITEIGHEKERYLVAKSTIITPDSIRDMSLESEVLCAVRKMSGYREWTTRMDY